METIAEFLRQYPPFDSLSADALATVAAAVEVERIPAGWLIAPQAAEPSRSVRIVREGSVELVESGRTIDEIRVGELFGHASMLSGLPTALGIRTAEDTVVYTIPEAVMQPVFLRPEGVRFLVRSLDVARWLDSARLVAGPDPTSRRVAAMLRGEPVVCRSDDTIRSVAERMASAGQSAAVVDLGAGSFGIVTDRDLRRRVVAAARSVDDAVSSVMSAPAYTTPAETPGSAVLLEMLEHGVTHLPVVSATGALVGVISDTDLLSVERRTPFRLRSAIAQASSVEEAQQAAARLPDMVLALSDAKVSPAIISETMSVVVDTFTRRLLDIVIAEQGDPPAAFSWLALGSHARRETVLSSDLDSALLWLGGDQDTTIKTYVRGVARRVVDAQTAAGFPACDKGAVAAKPLFSRSLDAWREAASSWLNDPDQEAALILVSVVVDGRPIWAQREGAALPEAFREARTHPRLLRGLARFALAHRPATGLLRDIVVEQSGEHRGRLDIKRGGLLPITDTARYVGMAAGIAHASTRERLHAAVEAGTIPAGEARTLEEAYDLFTTLRLDHQVAQVRSGQPADDYLDPAALSPLARSYLKEAFRAVAATQKRLLG
jgi:CBS domain-containing protein